MSELQGEAGFIDWLRSRIAGHPRVPVGPGDDAAVIEFPAASRCIVTTDMLLEAPERGPVLRSGAKAGDAIFVTGPLGGSIFGHHLDFVPRVRESLALHKAVDLHALTDISDGFALDLSHIARESNCGAVVF